MSGLARLCAVTVSAVLVLAGCSSGDDASSGDASSGAAAPAAEQKGWTDEDVSFVADGLTIAGTYRHDVGGPKGPAALLISESGNTDRNGDNAVAGPVGNMRQLAEYLSDKTIASLRYDKVGTGKTGLGPYAANPTEVGSAVYTTGAKAAMGFLAAKPGSEPTALSVFALGEGTVHAMQLAGAAGGPRIRGLGLFQPLAGRYLDMITARVNTSVAADVKAGAKSQAQAGEVIATWTKAVDEARTKGTVPAQLPEGLSAVLNPTNVKAVVEADAVDPLALARKIPAGTPVLLSCSDSDSQAYCDAERPLIEALGQTALTVVELKGVSHVLRDDPTDNVGNYAKQDPLSPQLTGALDVFVAKIA